MTRVMGGIEAIAGRSSRVRIRMALCCNVRRRRTRGVMRAISGGRGPAVGTGRVAGDRSCRPAAAGGQGRLVMFSDGPAAPAPAATGLPGPQGRSAPTSETSEIMSEI